jgi:probable HAF family extracellular repeat protein
VQYALLVAGVTAKPLIQAGHSTRRFKEEDMRYPMTAIVTMVALLTFAGPVHLMAQHSRYRLIDVGTLGGPNSSIGFESSPLNSLSNDGVFSACSETTTPDPNFPNFSPLILGGSYGLPQPDPLIIHAFHWKDGTLTDLGALPGVNSSCVSHISGNGWIAGQSENGAIDPITGWPESQAVLWKNGRVVNLGTLGGNESFSIAVNNRGQVVGLAENATSDSFGLGFGQQARAFLWERGLMRDLGTLGGPDAFAIDINDRGQILGVSFINSIPDPTTGVPTLDGFLWENGKMIDIPDPLGGTQISPYYLSERGQVVGNANLAGDNFEQARHPFLWEKRKFTDLGTFGGSTGDAYKINDAGQIVGDASFADTTYHAALWQNGSISDLGTIGTDLCSVAQDINSRGQAVGWSGVCDYSAIPRAFLWDKTGPVVDLNMLIPSASGIYVFFPSNINDRGEISASGILPNGDTHAVLLIPCGTDDAGCEDDARSNAVSSSSRSNTFFSQPLSKAALRPIHRSRFSHYQNLLTQQPK